MERDCCGVDLACFLLLSNTSSCASTGTWSRPPIKIFPTCLLGYLQQILGKDNFNAQAVWFLTKFFTTKYHLACRVLKAVLLSTEIEKSSNYGLEDNNAYNASR